MAKTEAKIPVNALPKLQGLIEKLNKRATKLKLPLITFKLGAIEFKKLESEAGEVHGAIKVQNVTIFGESPVINGWRFIGTLQHIEDQVIIRAVPGYELPIEFREANAGNCDHCHTERNRKETFVLQGDAGHKQVGRNCLVDFLGDISVADLAKQCEWLLDLGAAIEDAEDDREAGSYPRGNRYFSMAEFLGCVAARIRVDGWTSRTKGRELGIQATADHALTQLFRPSHGEPLREEYNITKADQQLVEKAIDWAREALATKNDKSDYEHNLTVACGMDYIDHRLTGIVASVLPAFSKELAFRAKKVSKGPGNWLGEVGKRQLFENLLLVKKISIFGEMYETTLCKFESPEGEDLTWFASNESDLVIGERYTLKATVKKHDTYNDRKQTIITRAKVVAQAKEAA